MNGCKNRNVKCASSQIRYGNTLHRIRPGKRPHKPLNYSKQNSLYCPLFTESKLLHTRRDKDEILLGTNDQSLAMVGFCLFIGNKSLFVRW